MMTYLVLETHRAYAVVLDSEGRFLKVANLGYAVGQELEEVMAIEEKRALPFSLSPRFVQGLAAAAVMVFMVLGSWQVLLSPQGSVEMQINPDIMATVNRLDRVIRLEGLNPDGVTLIEDYQARMQPVDRVARDLAVKALQEGYLTDGGQINLIIDGQQDAWVAETGTRLSQELEAQFEGRVRIVILVPGETPPPAPEPIVIPVEPEPAPTPSPAPVSTPTPAQVTPAPAPAPAPTYDDDDDDDDWDDADDDDADDDD